jgi:glycosyltransferase involved in cell wall biosynthesis
MLVTVITVCRNSAATIRDTLDSLLAQSYPHIEYLLIDGCSSDGTLEILHSYKEAFQRKGYAYRILSEPDRGIYDAMNKGLALATGELIGIINSDDWYEPQAVQTAVEEYRRQAYDIFYGALNLVRCDGSVLVKRSRLDRFPSSRHWNHPTTFIPARVYRQFGGYRCRTLYDDFDLMLRLRRKKTRVRICDKILANFRTGGVSTGKSLRQWRHRIGARYRCYRDNGYSPLYFLECAAMETAKLILS